MSVLVLVLVVTGHEGPACPSPSRNPVTPSPPRDAIRACMSRSHLLLHRGATRVSVLQSLCPTRIPTRKIRKPEPNSCHPLSRPTLVVVLVLCASTPVPQLPSPDPNPFLTYNHRSSFHLQNPWPLSPTSITYPVLQPSKSLADPFAVLLHRSPLLIFPEASPPIRPLSSFTEAYSSPSLRLHLPDLQPISTRSLPLAPLATLHFDRPRPNP